MLDLKRWQTTPALVVSLGIGSGAIAPLCPTPAVLATPSPALLAQLFPSPASRGSIIPAGTKIPVRYNAADKIIVAPNETVPLTLTIPRTVRTSAGVILISAGSQVVGSLQPAGDGSQFIAQTLILQNKTQTPMNASSEIVTTRQEVVPGVSSDALIKGSAIGAGAATLLSGVLGNRRITLGKILLGAGAGAAGGLIFGKKTAEVIVINPNEDLTLTLNAPLGLGSGY